MVVLVDAPADRVHQEEVDGLVEADPIADEEVADGPERGFDLDLDPRLLAGLAAGGLLDRLAAVGRALRQRPEQRATAMDEQDRLASLLGPMDDSPG